jgi:hypothetical protein
MTVSGLLVEATGALLWRAPGALLVASGARATAGVVSRSLYRRSPCLTASKATKSMSVVIIADSRVPALMVRNWNLRRTSSPAVRSWYVLSRASTGLLLGHLTHKTSACLMSSVGWCSCNRMPTRAALGLSISLGRTLLSLSWKALQY